MNSGYHNKTGNMIFQPLPRDTMEMCKTDMEIKKERRRQDKDHWLEILGRWSAYIIIGMVLIVIAYVSVNKQAEMSSNFKEATKAQTDAQIELAKINENNLNDCLDYINNRDNFDKKDNINKDKPPDIPLIE